MKKLIIIAIFLISPFAFSLIEVPNVTLPKALKLNFDFFVKGQEGFYSKEYSGNAVVDNREEIVFSYNNRIVKSGEGVKISIKPFITSKGTHFLVKYYKQEKATFYLVSKSLVKQKAGKDSKIQIVDGDKIYKLMIRSKGVF